MALNTLTLILKIICQWDVRYIMVLPIKTIIPGFVKLLDYDWLTTRSYKTFIPGHWYSLALILTLNTNVVSSNIMHFYTLFFKLK